ncbi:MAG: hypothetical protein QNK92_12530 [Amylibacter sp.]
MAAPRTILLAADGFIDRHLAYGLRDLGHTVVCVARNPAPLCAMGFETIGIDFTSAEAQTTEFWRKHLPAADHLVNCAGLLNGTDAALQAVHVTAPAAYAAMPAVATSVLISAVGIDTQIKFARYRRAGAQRNRPALRFGPRRYILRRRLPHPRTRRNAVFHARSKRLRTNI